MDGQTDRHNNSLYRARIASRGKNCETAGMNWSDWTISELTNRVISLSACPGENLFLCK